MKKSKGEKVWIVLLLAAALLSACGGRTSSGNNSAGAVGSTPVAMRVVTDDLGRSVTIPTKVTRVVSLAPNLTENIFAVGAGDRLVGVTTFCNYPEEAKSIAKIGDTMNPNMESIVALKPDIVFVSTASQIEAFMKTLEANGIAVYVSNPGSLEGVMTGIRRLGDLFGTASLANALAESLNERVAKVRSFSTYDPRYPMDLVYQNKVFVQISKEPLFTIGKSSFLQDVIVSAGGQSVTANLETDYPKVSKETALTLNPEVVILSDSEDNKEPNEVFKNSPAVKNGRVYRINADLISRPGPRLVDALEQIAKDLHPEKFK